MILSLQLSTIASQPALGVELLSQAFKSASTKPSSADPQKKPISVETIEDVSKTIEDENPSTSIPNVAKVSPQNFLILIQLLPSPDYLSCQTLSEETPSQEESDSLPIENDPVGIENNPAVVDT